MEKKENRPSGGKNREKGHRAERHYADIFRDMGYEDCRTSRYASRMHDDAGIDLVGLPWNVQVKAGKQRGMRYADVLAEMRERTRNLPRHLPERNRPCLLIHRRDAEAGKRRRDEDDLVTLTFADFRNIVMADKH